MKRLQHPYLYFTAEDIPALKAKLKHPWMQKKWATFLRRGELLLSEDIYPEPSRDLIKSAPFHYTSAVGEGSTQFYRRAPMLALMYLLSGDSRYLKRAKEHLLDVCNWSMWAGCDLDGRPDPGLAAGLFGLSVAMMYDWLFDELSEPERRVVRDCLAQRTADAYCQKYLVNEPDGMPGPEINWPAQWFCGVGMAGLALWEEHPQAMQWVKHAEDVMREILKGNDPDGGGHEGLHYVGYMTSNVMIFADALRHVTGTNLFNEPFVRNLSKYFLYESYDGPDEIWQVNFNDTMRGDLVVPTIPILNRLMKKPRTFSDYSYVAYGMVMAFVAREYKDRQALWLYVKWLERIDPRDKILSETWNYPLEIIWFDQSLQPEPPDALPLSRHFRGIDWVFCRTGWKPVDTFFAFKSGRGRWWHIHGDINHFIVWADGKQLIIDPGIEIGIYPKSMEDHVKARERMEKISMFYRSTGHNILTVDGEGQLADASTSNHRRYGREAGRSESMEQGGKILDFIDCRFGFYLESDGRGPYYGRLRKWNRHIFSAGLRYLVIYDDVECNGDRQIEWTLHTPKDLVLHGREAVLTRNGGELMTVRALLTDDILIQKKEGFMEGFVEVAPEENPENKPQEDFIPKADFLSLESKGKVSEIHFLNVVDVHKDGQRRTESIESISAENIHGVRVLENGHESSALFRAGPGTMAYEGMYTNAGFAFFEPMTNPKRILLSEADFLTINGVHCMSCDRPVTLGLEYTDKGFVGYIKTTTRVYVKLHMPDCLKSVTIGGEDVEYDYDPQTKLALFMVHRGTFDISATACNPGEKPTHLRKFPGKREIIF